MINNLHSLVSSVISKNQVKEHNHLLRQHEVKGNYAGIDYLYLNSKKIEDIFFSGKANNSNKISKTEIQVDYKDVDEILKRLEDLYSKNPSEAGLLKNIVCPYLSNSELKDDFFHATTKKALKDIKKNGFKIRLKNAKKSAGYGVYLAFNAKDINHFPGSNVIARFTVNLKNPCLIKDPGIKNFTKLKNNLDKLIENYSGERFLDKDQKIAAYNESLRQIFIKEGYDSVIIQYPDTYTTNLVVFYPQLVKLVGK